MAFLPETGIVRTAEFGLAVGAAMVALQFGADPLLMATALIAAWGFAVAGIASARAVRTYEKAAWSSTVLVGLMCEGGVLYWHASSLSAESDERAVMQELKKLQQLTQQLVARSTAAPGPGTEASVGEALKATAQGAERGDERMRKALDLLQANKVAEATSLFQAVAAEQEAHAVQNRKDAAAAYRNLGAIAGLRDPKQAFDAYAKAIENDPSDVESLFWVAWFRKERGALTEAEADYRRLLALVRTDEEAWFRCWALNGIGDVLSGQGNLPDSLKSFRDARAEADRKSQSDPANPVWQSAIAASDDKIGDALTAQGNLPDALNSYREARTIRERLVQANPGHNGRLRDLAVSDDEIATALYTQGNLFDALDNYRSGHVIFEQLAASDPDNVEWQRDLSVSDDEIGEVLLAQGDLSEALASYRADFAITDRLARADPENAGLEHDLSMSYDEIGDVQLQQSDSASALQSYHYGHAILEKLTQSYPKNTSWQGDLAASYRRIGDTLHAQGDFSAALDTYGRGLTLAGNLVTSEPDDAIWQDELGKLYARSGAALRGLGDRAKALDTLQRGREILERIVQLHPDNAEWARDLASCRTQIAELTP
jgi:tetratricopeptide (TPR) repeat protein